MGEQWKVGDKIKLDGEEGTIYTVVEILPDDSMPKIKVVFEVDPGLPVHMTFPEYLLDEEDRVDG